MIHVEPTRKERSLYLYCAAYVSLVWFILFFPPKNIRLKHIYISLQ